MLPEEIQREFDKLAPWSSRFVIDGRAYGGTYDVVADGRLAHFFDYFPAPATILDLGSHEGHTSFLLAQNPSVQKVLGLEGREKNLARANLVRTLLNLANVEFRQANLETLDLATLGRFDVVLCAGLLYHLPNPWDLVGRISRVTKNLFLCTHYAPDERVTTGAGPYRGLMYQEGGLADINSGLSPASFWPTLGSLLGMLHECGFKTIHIIDNNPAFRNGPYVTLAATSG